MPRAKNLKFAGEFVERRDPEGNVLISGFAQSFPGVPTRDLDESDIAELTDEQYRDATASGLYVDPVAKKAAAPALTAAQKDAHKRGYTVGTPSPPDVDGARKAQDASAAAVAAEDAEPAPKAAAAKAPAKKKAAATKTAAPKPAPAPEPAAEPVNEGTDGGDADGARAES